MTNSFSPYIVVPMKDPSTSKSRLKVNMDQEFCEKIATLMFERTVQLLRQNFPHIPLLVVTESTPIARYSVNTGCIVLCEASPPGLNISAWSAAQWGQHHKFDSQILIHADLPLLSQQEIEKTIAGVSKHEKSIAICKSWSGGTSILATRQPDVINFRFGSGSYVRHLEAAQVQGVPVTELGFLGASMDLDTDVDLAEILNQGESSEAFSQALSC